MHDKVDQSKYDAAAVCDVHAYTTGGTCTAWCAKKGMQCIHAQDQIGASCSLDKNHHRQTFANNGCDQKWNNQICGCVNDKATFMAPAMVAAKQAAPSITAVASKECDGKFCSSWNCAQWCKCFDPALNSVYASFNCVDDGEDTCTC